MSDKNQQIITRFAPSPTGFLHMGNYRTALFNFLFAKQNNGKLILRIEDTDRERSKKEYEENIIQSLSWLGLTYDDFYRQSERVENHKAYLQKLIDIGAAYISKEEVKEEGDRPEVIRFKNPNKKITFTDLIRGDITFDTTELGNFVIAKSLEEPVFHLAVVADDFDMGVTHIVRGEDHISNTPRQILIQEALGAPRPIYAHLPLILAPDKTKLSKRNGAKAVTWYKDEGYLSSTLINFMALLGWNPGSEQEVFDLPQLIKLFDISKVQKGGAVFNEEKLSWLNKEHLKKISPEILISQVELAVPWFKNLNNKQKEYALPILVEHANTIGDIRRELEASYFTQTEELQYNSQDLVWKKSTKEEAVEHLFWLKNTLLQLPEENFNTEEIKKAVWDYASLKGKGNVLWPLRFALSGKDKSPDPFTLANLLGKERTLTRVAKALTSL